MPYSARRSNPIALRRTLQFVSLLVGSLIVPLVPRHASAQDLQQLETHFETHVRPLLVARCVGCHGPLKQEAGLRLDSGSAVQVGGDSGPVLVAGNSRESLLIQAIERSSGLEMPPDRPLEPAEIEAFRIWIDQGAYWPVGLDGRDRSLSDQHWAFQSVEPPQVPLESNAERDGGSEAIRPIDRFVAQAQQARGLSPLGEADRATLLRRMSFDLTGLPPSFDEVERFMNDSRPDAYERQLDRTLASARFGEHWARHWLDVARYADNKGYVFFEQKEYPWAWTYRDWVRQSLDADWSYDRFLIDQLAADLVAPNRPAEELAGLGFLAVGGHFVNNSHDIIDDRIDLISRGLTGLTLACARCHDHKYDPLTQADYYALYGVLASCYEPLVPPAIAVVAPGASSGPTDAAAYESELAKRLNDLQSFVQGKVDGLATSGRRRVDEYLLAVHERRRHPSAEEFMLIADPDDINPSMITRYEAYLRDQVDESHPIWGPWIVWSNLDHWDSVEETERAIEPRRETWSPTLVRYLTEPAPSSLAELATRYGVLMRWIDKRHFAIPDPPPAPLDPLDLAHWNWTSDELQAFDAELFALGKPAVLPVQLDWGFLSLFPDRATQGEYNAKLTALEAWMNESQAPVRAMVLVDRPEPVNLPVFLRGNPNRPGQRVARSVYRPGAGRAAVEQGSGRWELAQTLVDPAHPTTDRVWVNRVWMHVLGEPLVESPGDFGLRSDQPLIFELLDHLVVQFRQSDRSSKSLIRELMLSATYRRSSYSDSESLVAMNVDPRNATYWRAHRKRLTYEAMRDSLLQIAEQLSTERGGPALKAIDQWGRRRSLYLFIDRLDVAPVLSRFDFPDPNATSPRRVSTTVPTQALFWMNDQQVESIARELAALSLKLSPAADAKTRIERMIERVWQRPAEAFEVQAALDFLDSESMAHGGTIDESSWVRLAQALLMANETTYID